MIPKGINKKRGALSSPETELPEYLRKDLEAAGFGADQIGVGDGSQRSQTTGHIADAESYSNMVAGVTPDNPDGYKSKSLPQDPIYQDPKAPQGKKRPLQFTQAKTMKGSNPSSRRSGKGDRERAAMMQNWLNERRDTNFDKYRGPKGYTPHTRPRGILSK